MGEEMLSINKFLILDPDIMKGDGVYSRYYSAMIEGMHFFEITVVDNGNTAYSWQETPRRENCKLSNSILYKFYTEI